MPSESITLTLTHPSGSPARLVHPASIEYNAALNEPATLRLEWDSEWTRLSPESSATNPGQLNSHVALLRNGYAEFGGRIVARNLDCVNIPRRIYMDASDQMAALGEAAASLGGYAVTTRALTSTQLSTIDMVPVTTGSLTYYPSPVTALAAWRATSGSPQTVYTAGTATWGVGTLITATANHCRMLPTGLLKTATGKYVYYDGYDLNSAFTLYEFRQVIWDALGVAGFSPADDLAASKVSQFMPRRVDPAKTLPSGLVYELYIGGTLKSEGQDYVVNYEEGSVTLASSPGASAVTATFYAYDEDNPPSTGLWLGGAWDHGIIDLLLAETRAHGGPELAMALVSILIPRIVIPRLELRGQRLLPVIRQLLEEQGEQGVSYESSWPNENAPIMAWLDPNNSSSPGTSPQLRIECVSQSASPTYLPNAEAQPYDYTLSDIYSQVIVTWTENQVSKGALVRLTATYSAAAGNQKLVYMPLAYVKLLGDTGTNARWQAFPRSLELPLGECSEAVAISAARQRLVDSLSYAGIRRYKLQPLPTRLPRLGVTYTTPDGFTGVCAQRDYSLRAREDAKASVTLVDMSASGRLS